MEKTIKPFQMGQFQYMEVVELCVMAINFCMTSQVFYFLEKEL